MAELPAGMLDDSGTFAGAAAKEITEETGLEIPADDLIDMTQLALSPDPSSPPPTANPAYLLYETEQALLQKAVYPSPGGSDEFIPLFLYQKRIPRSQLREWEGKLTGLRDHGEKITLRLCRLEDLWRVGGRDAKALSGWALYEGLRRSGKL